MKIWVANPLENKKDIFQRGFFRFFWCMIGLIVIGGFVTVLTVLGYRQTKNTLWLVFVLFATTVVVTVLGIVIDFMRLNKHQQK